MRASSRDRTLSLSPGPNLTEPEPEPVPEHEPESEPEPTQVNEYFLGVDAARFSVVSFATDATTRVPWSYNAAEINAGVDAMTAGGWTSISDGFDAARQLFGDGGRLGVTKIVLLLLDGEQTVDAEFRVQSLFEPNTANRPRKPYKPLLASNDGRRSD